MKYLLGRINSRYSLITTTWSEVAAFHCRRLPSASGSFVCYFHSASSRQTHWLHFHGLPDTTVEPCLCPYIPISNTRYFCTSPEKSPKHEEKVDNVAEDVKKLSVFQKFKVMYKKYWYVLVPVHIVTSIGWFGGFYYLVKSGVDVVALLESWNFSEVIIRPLRDSSAGYVAVSYALYKIATPLRYTVTLGGTTLSINYFTKWGLIKPIPPAEKLKEMYEEKKENLKERRDQLKEKGEAMMREFRDKGSKK